jgi:hypothetical protein
MSHTPLRTSTPLALFLSSVFVLGCSSGPVPAPTAFTKIESADKQFRVEHPNGWQVTTTGGMGTLSHCIFEAGAARIDIAADLMGSLMAGPSGPPSDPNVEPPVARVHEMGKAKFAEEFSNYEEQEARPVQTALGEGRIAEFTATGSMGRKLRGYRATVLSRDRRITAMCSCPVSEWETLKPAFEKVIGSLQPSSSR